MTRGTVVKLKSGGPAMKVLRTVVSHKDDSPPSILCLWDDKNKKLKSAYFTLDQLEVLSTAPIE